MTCLSLQPVLNFAFSFMPLSGWGKNMMTTKVSLLVKIWNFLDYRDKLSGNVVDVFSFVFEALLGLKVNFGKSALNPNR